MRWQVRSVPKNLPLQALAKWRVVQLGVHYASDVLGGFALAIMLMVIGEIVKQNINRRP